MRKIILRTFTLTLVLLSAIICVINAAEPKTSAYSYSTCNLINPPDTNLDWTFNGNQAVWVSLRNDNVLGVTATVGEYFTGTWTYQHYVISPMSATGERMYTTFGEPPIVWKFNISTGSSVAMILATARWFSYL